MALQSKFEPALKTLNEFKAETERVYDERSRAIPFASWWAGVEMYVRSPGATDDSTDKFWETMASSKSSVQSALVNAARVGLPMHDGRLAKFIVMGGIRYSVTPDGRIRLHHQAGITTVAYAIYDCDVFEMDLGAQTVRHIPDNKGRAATKDMDGETIPMARVVAAWARGTWYDQQGRQHSAIGYADPARLDAGYNAAKNKGVWDNHPAPMAANAAVRVLERYLPLSVELDALSAYERTEHDDTPPATDTRADAEAFARRMAEGQKPAVTPPVTQPQPAQVAPVVQPAATLVLEEDENEPAADPFDDGPEQPASEGPAYPPVELFAAEANKPAGGTSENPTGRAWADNLVVYLLQHKAFNVPEGKTIEQLVAGVPKFKVEKLVDRYTFLLSCPEKV